MKSLNTLLLTEGHSVEMIKELLGHEDIKTTQIYLGSFDDDAKDNGGALGHYRKFSERLLSAKSGRLSNALKRARLHQKQR